MKRQIVALVNYVANMNYLIFPAFYAAAFIPKAQKVIGVPQGILTDRPGI